jgi:hypothetical protein
MGQRAMLGPAVEAREVIFVGLKPLTNQPVAE